MHVYNVHSLKLLDLYVFTQHKKIFSKTCSIDEKLYNWTQKKLITLSFVLGSLLGMRLFGSLSTVGTSSEWCCKLVPRF